MINWLRRILGEAPVCSCCEILKTELSAVRYEREKLLNHIIGTKIEEPIIQGNMQPLGRRFIIPSQMRAQLEQRDRLVALSKIREEQEQKTAELEREVGINDRTENTSIS